VTILGWIVVGLIAGGFARLVTGGAKGVGCLATIVIGIVGAVIGGWLFSLVGEDGADGFNLWSIFVAFCGAVVLLVIVGLFTRGRYGGRG